VGHQPSRLGWGAISDLIRSKGSQQKATRICSTQKRAMGSRIGNQSGSRLFDRSRGSDRNGLSSASRDIWCCMIPDVAVSPSSERLRLVAGRYEWICIQHFGGSPVHRKYP
jgi:hypothetical protein